MNTDFMNVRVYERMNEQKSHFERKEFAVKVLMNERPLFKQKFCILPTKLQRYSAPITSKNGIGKMCSIII